MSAFVHTLTSHELRNTHTLNQLRYHIENKIATVVIFYGGHFLSLLTGVGDPREERPEWVATNQNIEKVHNIIPDDHCFR